MPFGRLLKFLTYNLHSYSMKHLFKGAFFTKMTIPWQLQELIFLKMFYLHHAYKHHKYRSFITPIHNSNIITQST